MEPASDPPQRRYRRRVIGVVALAVVLLVGLGTAITVSPSGSDPASTSDVASDSAASATPSPTPSSTTSVGSAPAGASQPSSTDASTDASADAAADEGDVSASELPSLSEVVVESPSFSTFEQLLADAEMWESINEAAAVEPLTVFAPTDEAFDRAFERLGADGYAQLFDAGTLRAVLGAHLVTPELTTGELRAGPLSTMGDGQVVVAVEPEITLTSGSITARLGAATDTNIRTAAGVVHAIDEVLIPDALEVTTSEPLPDLRATFEDGVLAIDGSVSSPEEEQLLRDAARTSVHPDNVRFAFADDVTGSTVDGVERMSAMLLVMAPNLASGTVTLNADELDLVGVELDPTRGERLAVLAADLGATAALETRPIADESAAQRLQRDLDAAVGDEPIRFTPSDVTVEPTAVAMLERIAARVRALDGIAVTVVGHTDSDGSASDNLALSAARAAVVRDALIVGGVDPAVVVVKGRGEAEPVVDTDTGAEDKAASRRIEFVVVLADPAEVGGG